MQTENVVELRVSKNVTRDLVRTKGETAGVGTRDMEAYWRTNEIVMSQDLTYRRIFSGWATQEIPCVD